MELLGLNLPFGPTVSSPGSSNLPAGEAGSGAGAADFGLLLQQTWSVCRGSRATGAQVPVDGLASPTAETRASPNLDLWLGQLAPVTGTADGVGLLRGEDLVAALQTRMQDPELNLSAAAVQYLEDWLEGLPREQLEALGQWLEGGKEVPEAATQLLDLLADWRGADLEPADLAVTPDKADTPEGLPTGTDDTATLGASTLVAASQQVSPNATRAASDGPVTDGEAGWTSTLSPSATSLKSLLDGQAATRPDSAESEPLATPALTEPNDDVSWETLARLDQGFGLGRPTGDASGALRGLTTATGHIATPLGQPTWGSALGERVLWMVGNHVQSAEVRLNPPDLGPVEIRVAISQDQASVTFTAPHALTRETIEAAIPRLREMLAESQLTLSQVTVGEHAGGQNQAQGSDRGTGQRDQGRGWNDGAEESEPGVAAAQVRTLSSGLFDDFA